MGYYDSLPPSFGSQVFSNTDNAKLSSFNFASTYNSKFTDLLGVDTTFGNSGSGATSGGWTFITAPEDISWDVNNQATRIDIFGTNNPPVVAGSRGMRDLTLGNSLVEGFVRNVTVEDKIAALENLMNYKINQSDGFVNVPVYQIWANSKAYGNGYFIIKDIKVKESMRDLKGNATRAYVDISLMEVPAYQVNSGRDLASQPAAAAKSILPTINGAVGGGNPGSIANATNSVDKNVPPAKRAGATGPTPGKGGSTSRLKNVKPGLEIPFSAPPR
jgi:hypothetical protein